MKSKLDTMFEKALWFRLKKSGSTKVDFDSVQSVDFKAARE